MQFIVCYIISLSCLYSLVISAPIKQNVQEVKHEKTSAAANHLLNKLADEKIKSDSENQDNDDIVYIPIIEYSASVYDDSLLEISDDFDDFLPTYDSELITDLDETFTSHEDSIIMTRTTIMDDTTMKTENH